MGFFEDQIEERKQSDDQMLEDSLLRVSGVVLGNSYAQKITDESIICKNAVDEILKYFHQKPAVISSDIKDFDQQLNYCLRPSGIMRREVILEEGWYKDSFGPIMGFSKDDGEAIALLPGEMSGYYFRNPQTGKRERVTSKNSGLFGSMAYCFYRPFPQKKLGIPDLILYMRSYISTGDLTLLVVSIFMTTLVGLMLPSMTRLLTGPAVRSGKVNALVGVAISMVCVTLTQQMIGITKNLMEKRIDIKTSIAVQAAMMMRIISLPTQFFRKYSPGELHNRSQSVNSLCSMITDMMLNTSLTSIASLMYIGQIFHFAPSLALPAFIIVIITVAFSIASTFMQIKVTREHMEHASAESGLTYALITGVQKLKLSGSEKRAFAKWADAYGKTAELIYNPPLFIKMNSVISTAITLFSTIVIYFMAIKSNLDQSTYFAFSSSYGMLMGAFMSFAGIALTLGHIKPIIEMAKPFLEAEPEESFGKEIVTDIRGSIELENVSFRYDEDSPYVLKDISFKVRAGEYVAIVGKTGCGKSTLVRLLLGFEKPEKGVVYFDGRDISSYDILSLRKKMGIVTQDAGLFQGDVYSNIAISNPSLTMDEAWEAAEIADIADDIREMPMGMATMIGEGQGGISGGQRQRIMIARAIAGKPKVLIFDEATSALDNSTQKHVAEALEKMGCTRVVIAHRLSTIKNCDRILVLDDGRIIEQGTYSELLEKQGYFAELVERQRI
jgi:NHLM bacteriocin system ABC transporter ATP-binding protein